MTITLIAKNHTYRRHLISQLMQIVAAIYIYIFLLNKTKPNYPPPHKKNQEENISFCNFSFSFLLLFFFIKTKNSRQTKYFSSSSRLSWFPDTGYHNTAPVAEPSPLLVCVHGQD